MPSVSQSSKSPRGHRAHKPQPRKHRRKRRPIPPQPPLTIVQLKEELEELTTALGCMPHVLSMAQAMSRIVPSLNSTSFGISDYIDLEHSAFLMAAAARIRMTRLLQTMKECGLRLEAEA